MYNDLRHFLKVLTGQGEIVQVSRQVSIVQEIGDICRRVSDMEGPALLFTNLAGYPGWSLCANAVGTLRRTALAIESTVEAMVAEYARRIEGGKLLPSVTVPAHAAPCKEVILRDVDLTKLPIPTWHLKDGGPYISFGVQISKDPDSGVPNASIVRQMVLGPKRLGILLLPGKHTMIHFEKQRQRGRDLELAAAIGVEPTVTAAALHSGSLDEDEFAVCGALRGQPLEMVRCETIDVEVPAHAELVIEGRLLHNETAAEGPFGEFTGYYTKRTDTNPAMEVTCITHRRNPIFQGTYEGKPPNEDNIFHILPYSASVYAEASRLCPNLVSFAFDPYGSGFIYAVAAIDKLYPGHAHHAMHAVWATQSGKYIKVLIVVDKDINIFDHRAVTWAIATRFQPGRDLVLDPRGIGSQLDPAAWPKSGIGGSMGIDATQKWEQEGGPPKGSEQELISHAASPFWREIERLGLGSYLGVDLSRWQGRRVGM
ncbi:MAG: UbiD family decarboxylase [Candidatus Tectomicrobia bacterium]|nr:UbiD family decarboxylase [Candidatus Tectomicrobia bacterium]